MQKAQLALKKKLIGKKIKTYYQPTGGFL